jgi:Mor family transcriptional regulator
LSDEVDAVVSLRYDLVRILRESVGMPEDSAALAAEQLVHGLGARRGGLYITKREAVRVRDDFVRRDFDGRNRNEVLRRYGISIATFYRIIGAGVRRNSHIRGKVRIPRG